MVGHGRYTVVRKLADGGMAEIFLATLHGSQGFEKNVVLKRIHAAFVADEQFRNMLIDEAHISMSLSHNNIVQVLDLGQAGGRYFMALELVDGWDLGRILQRAAASRLGFPSALALYVVAQVCRALDYAHNKIGPEGRAFGIVHRDVSPQNVLISEQGEVKLADFGIAKARRKRDQTDSGVVKGKISYMSPEQAAGQELDARSDLYSLGTLIYMLTTGRRPFEGATDLEILLRVQRGQYTPPEEAKPDLHPTIAGVIKRAMAFDRDRRYASAHQMLVDVEGVLRTNFGSPGQTELKLWLAELARLDHEPSIGRAVRVMAPTGSAPGSSPTAAEMRIGKELELVDEMEPEDELGQVPSFPEPDDDLSATSPRRTRTTASLAPASLTPRLTGSEPTGLQDLRLSQSLLAVDGPMPIRSTKPSRGNGFLIALVVLLVFGAVGAGIWHASAKTQQTTETTEATPTPAAATTPTPAASGPQVRTLPSQPKDEDVTIEGREPTTTPEPAPAAAPTHEARPSNAAGVRNASREPQKWRRADEIPGLLDNPFPDGSKAVANPAGDPAKAKPEGDPSGASGATKDPPAGKDNQGNQGNKDIEDPFAPAKAKPADKAPDSTRDKAAAPEPAAPAPAPAAPATP